MESATEDSEVRIFQFAHYRGRDIYDKLINVQFPITKCFFFSRATPTKKNTKSVKTESGS